MTTVLISSPERATYVRTTLRDLNKRAGELILENGLLLRELKQNGYYKEWGFTSFDACVVAMQVSGEIDYGPRQARNFIAIVEMVDHLGLDHTTVDELSISKLREIASLPTPDAQRRLLERAKVLDVASVQAEAKQARDKAHGRDTDPLKPFPLYTSETQRIFLHDCLARARQYYALPEEYSDTGVLIDHILPEWFTSVPEA